MFLNIFYLLSRLELNMTDFLDNRVVDPVYFEPDPDLVCGF